MSKKTPTLNSPTLLTRSLNDVGDLSPTCWHYTNEQDFSDTSVTPSDDATQNWAAHGTDKGSLTSSWLNPKGLINRTLVPPHQPRDQSKVTVATSGWACLDVNLKSSELTQDFPMHPWARLHWRGRVCCMCQTANIAGLRAAEEVRHLAGSKIKKANLSRLCLCVL